MATVVLLPAVSMLGCAVLALAIGLGRERSPIASAVLGLVISLGLWNAGLGIAEVAAPGPARSVALRVSVLAMFAAVGFWILVALRHRWPRRSRGAGVTFAVLAPVGIFFVGAVTNPGHGWFLVPGAEWDPGRVGWAGPGTWVLAAFAFVSGFSGTAIFLLAGLRLLRRGETRPGLALTLTMLALPLVSLRPIDPDAVLPIAAAALTLTTLILSLTALRYPLLEPPPLGHREVIDHLRHGVLMANAAGEILDRNPAAAALLGFEPRGVAIADAVGRAVGPSATAWVHDALEGLGERGRPIVLELEDASGRTLEVSARPVSGEDGDALGQIATLRDRTEERRFADAALRKQKLETLGTLAAGIAHEVNNPLAFVRANLGEIARMGVAVDDRLAAGASRLAARLRSLGTLAREAQGGLERIQRAVSDVRRLASAPDSGDESIALDAVVREAVGLALRRSDAPPQIDTHFASDLPPLEGSNQLLVQAVLCLLLDAHQAIPCFAQPRIIVETGADDEGIFVRVRADGAGTPASVAGPATGRAFAGPPDASRVGLGLSVAAGIAHDHGGSLCTEQGGYVLRLAGVKAG